MASAETEQTQPNNDGNEKNANSAPVASSMRKRRRYEAKPDRSNRRDERRELMIKAKSLWEALRPKATGREKSQKLVGDLVDLLKGRIVEFVFRHDGSRIVQWMLAEGDVKQRALVLDELEDGAERKRLPGEPPFFVRLATDRYGKHLAIKLLRVTGKERRALVYERYLRGNVAALMRTAAGADALDVAFQTVINAAQRANLVVELLFSKEMRMLDGVRAKAAKDSIIGRDGVTRERALAFAECMQTLGDEFKEQILDSAAATLNALVDKDSTIRMSIVHSALKEFIDVAMKDCPPSRTREIAASLAPSMVHLTHTRAGAQVAVQSIKILDAKHRKKAVRSLKGHVRKVAEDEFGHRVLISLLEWVDDTKIVGSILFTEILSKSNIAIELAGVEDDDEKPKKKAKTGPDVVDVEYLLSLCKHKHARMVLLHLLVRKQTRYFHPDGYGHIWADIDTEKFGKMSKKDPDVRRCELLEKVRDGVRALVSAHVDELLVHTFAAPVVVGAVQDDGLRGTVATAVGKMLSDEERRRKTLASVCGSKTVATLFKVGGAEFAVDVDNAGTLTSFAEYTQWSTAL